MAEMSVEDRDRIRFECLEQVFRRGPVDQAVQFAEGWRDDKGIPLDISHLLLARSDLPDQVRTELESGCICEGKYGWHDDPMRALPSG